MSPKLPHLAAASAVATLCMAAIPAHAETIDFMSWTYAEDAGKETVEQLIANFEENTGHTVEPLGFAWGEMQNNIFLRYRSNDLPEVSQLQGRWLPTFQEIPQLADMNEVWGQAWLEERIDPSVLAMGRIDGNQYGMPWIAGSIGMVANSKVLEEAGVTEMPETVEEFKQALIAVRDNNERSVPYTMATTNNSSILLDFMIWNWTFGGELIGTDGEVTVDSKAGVDALSFMTELVNEDLASPEIDRPDSRRLFAQNESAFYFDAPGARSHIRTFSGQGEAFDQYIQPISTPVASEGDTPHSIQWGHLLVMFDEDGAPAEDSVQAQFIEYLISDEAQELYFEMRGVPPVTKQARASDLVQKDAYTADWGEAAGEPLRNEIAPWPNAAELTTIIGEEVQAAILGQKEPAQAIADMDSRMQDSMDSL